MWSLPLLITISVLFHHNDCDYYWDVYVHGSSIRITGLGFLKLRNFSSSSDIPHVPEFSARHPRSPPHHTPTPPNYLICLFVLFSRLTYCYISAKYPCTIFFHKRSIDYFNMFHQIWQNKFPDIWIVHDLDPDIGASLEFLFCKADNCCNQISTPFPFLFSQFDETNIPLLWRVKTFF